MEKGIYNENKKKQKEEGRAKKGNAKKPQKKRGKRKAETKPLKRIRATEEEIKQLGKDRKRAQKYVKDPERTGQLLDEAIKKAKQNKGNLERVWNELLALFRLVHAWRKGTYTEVPRNTIIWIIAAIIYFLNPFDVIPDFIPVIGYVDDAAVIGFVIKSIRSDLDNFLEWERLKE